VNTLKIACTGHIPDNHRSFVLRKLQEVTGQISGVAAISKCVGWFHGAAIEL